MYFLSYSIALLLLCLTDKTAADHGDRALKGKKSNKKSNKKNGKAKVDQHDVCVIGGGPSGTYASLLLEQRGYDVVLFEKESVVGGKTVPPFDGMDNIDRHLLIAESMPLAAQLFTDYEIPLKPRSELVNYVTDSGIVINEAFLPPPSEELQSALGRWVAAVSAPNVAADVFAVGHAQDVNANLFQPTVTFLTENNLLPLLPVLFSFLTNFGYDFLDELPAIYTLTMLNIATLLAAVQRNWNIAPYDKVIQAMASSLKDVRLDSTVTKVLLKDGLTQVVAQGQGTTYCDQVMIAFPQTSDTMMLVENLDSDIRTLFDEVKVVYYYEVLMSAPLEVIPEGAYHRLYDPESATDTTIPNVFLRGKGDKVQVLLNSGAVRRSQEEVFDLVRARVEKVYSGYRLEVDSMELYAEHLYLPHVKTESFENGFYTKLDEAQGKQGVYFLGGLVDFELVEECLQSTAAIIEAHF